ncbi:MAG TPA: hypothetical protein P5519_11455, partial [Spirochaetia bacterium]|nr:hypothetical protein [Spirochaetia bacterium]
MNTAWAKRIFSFVALALGIVLMTTCDLPFGLGGQIDLGAPRLEIRTPDKNAYLKGSITISGTAEDDTGLNRIFLTLKKRSGEVLLEQEVPVVNKTYSLTLDTTSGVYDGEILVALKATDGFNKSVDQTTPVFIDNKAPTVLVTAPLTRNSGTPPQYTNSIDLKGEVYDQSPLVDVSVTLLKPDGSILAGPQKADGTNTWTTRFNLKDEGTGNELIPGLADGAIYHYRVDVTDAAGNQNSYYFHRKDINAIKANGTPFPSMNEIGRIDQNGTTGPVSGITAAALQTVRLTSIANFGDFKYIAAPQIEFQFTNISINGTAEENILAPKSKITGIITPPLNSSAMTAITREDVKVEIYDYSENLIVTHQNTDIDSDSDYIAATSIGDSLSFAFALVDAAGVDLPPERYKLKLYAKTDNNTSGVTNFFEVTIDAESPLFNETSILAGDIFRRGSFTMSFDGQHSTNLAKIEIYQAFGSNPFPGTPNETITTGLPATSFTGKLSSSLPYGASPADGLYNYRVVLSTVGGKTSVLLRSIVYDNTGPTVELTGFTKYATANKVNKTVTFSSVSSDANGINGTKYFVSTSGVAVPAYADVVGGNIVLIPGTASIDTTLLTDLGTYYLWIVSVDKAGNEGHSTAQQFVVDQSTDIPVITFSSVDTAVIAEAQVIGPPVKNLLVSGGKISGSITDDDGLPATATLFIDINKDNDFLDAGESISISLSGSGLTKTFDYSLGALADGTYRFYVDVADTTGVHNTAMTPVWFAYDTAVPTVTFNANATDANPVGPYRNADFTVQGTVQDSNGISKVEFSFDNGGTWEDLGITANPGENKPWTRAITAVSNNGAKTLLVRTTDTFGRTNVAGPVSVTIDTGLPSGTINAFGGGYYADTLLALSGTASDALSGIAKVEYSLVSNTGPWTLLTGTTTWFKNDIPAGALAEGTATVWVKVSDNAGNESAPVLSTTFTVDHNAPQITVDASFNGAVYKNAQFTIFGTVSDTNLGANPIAVSAKKDGANHNLTGTFTYNAGSWSQDVNIAGSGSYEITITATDAVGRQSVEKRTIVVDTVSPTVELTSFNKYATANKVNKTVTFSSVS